MEKATSIQAIRLKASVPPSVRVHEINTGETRQARKRRHLSQYEALQISSFHFAKRPLLPYLLTPFHSCKAEREREIAMAVAVTWPTCKSVCLSLSVASSPSHYIYAPAHREGKGGEREGYSTREGKEECLRHGRIRGKLKSS